MRIMQALQCERVTVDLAVTDRPGALMALARAFAANDNRLDSDQVGEALSAREQLASTNVGDGVAIPHARIHGLGEPQVAVSIMNHGLHFEDDDAPVHILVGLLTDAEDPRAHLTMLATLARTLSKPQIRYRMAAAQTAEDVVAALLESEQVSHLAPTPEPLQA